MSHPKRHHPQISSAKPCKTEACVIFQESPSKRQALTGSGSRYSMKLASTSAATQNPAGTATAAATSAAPAGSPAATSVSGSGSGGSGSRLTSDTTREEMLLFVKIFFVMGLTWLVEVFHPLLHGDHRDVKGGCSLYFEVGGSLSRVFFVNRS